MVANWAHLPSCLFSPYSSQCRGETVLIAQLQQSDGESMLSAWMVPGTRWPIVRFTNLSSLSLSFSPASQVLHSFFLKMRRPGVLSPWVRLLDSTVGLPSVCLGP